MMLDEFSKVKHHCKLHTESETSLAHQILGLRPFFNPKTGKTTKTDNTFFKRAWRVNSIPELLANIDQIINTIPQCDRWNLYYTVADCAEGKREFKSQLTLVFDLDGIDTTKIEQYIELVCSCLGVKREETGIIGSGNGLHFLIQLKESITDPLYFEQHRLHYNAICDKLKIVLAKANLPGEPDPAVFDARRILRLPKTENRKEGKETKHCTILQGVMLPTDFNLVLLSGIPDVPAGEQINAKTFKTNYPTPDTKAILEGCEFLKWCEKAPNEVSEAQWYGMLSIVPRLPNTGRETAHRYSAGHRAYTFEETEQKIDQATSNSGPRTCDNINKLWGKCNTCKYNGKVTSPIAIQGESYIKTRDSGFHTITINPETGKVSMKPAYEDLVLYFKEVQPYCTLGGSRICLIWTGTHWVEYADTYIDGFALRHFRPLALSKQRFEFKSLICCQESKEPTWFIETTNRHMNFKNGVLNIDNLELTPHSVTRGFRTVSKYEYDPNAKAPIFEKFMLDIMDNRKDLVQILMEYAGYCFSNDKCWAQVALIMTGGGSNGKSTFMDILKALAGEGNYSSLTLADLRTDTARKMLDGKLFNLAEETPTYAMSESSIFKNLVSGGETTVKTLYKQPYQIANKTKLMFACNSLPQTKDTTRGYFRRLLIVPFDMQYEDANKDPFLFEKLMGELPGIFNLVIKAYRDLRARQCFIKSTTLEAELNDYRSDLDTVKAWYEECIDDSFEYTDESNLSGLKDLYANYAIHAEAAGEKPETRAIFARRLRYLMPNWRHRKFRTNKIDGKKMQFRGVKLNDNSKF